MNHRKQPIITKFNCIVLAWFFAGVISSKILFGYFEIAVGFAYIFYPFISLFLWITSTDSGNQNFMDETSKVLEVLWGFYILIPLVISNIYDRLKNTDKKSKA
ncbi:hypothetical protein [Anaerosinus massiliensis]|uniref:hypothetical protein n=1 Tax=Massilibacillus massiliensis TaxID=1806837 RepID=UPI000DA63F65|nr:hypothetical protein [Massilibacillus massiliensis]